MDNQIMEDFRNLMNTIENDDKVTIAQLIQEVVDGKREFSDQEVNGVEFNSIFTFKEAINENGAEINEAHFQKTLRELNALPPVTTGFSLF